MTKHDIKLSKNLRDFVAVESDTVILDDKLEKFLGSAVSLANEYFDRAGEVRPHWIVQRANGTIAHLWLADQPTGGSVLEMPGHMIDEVVAQMAQRFKEEDVMRYAFICEAWQSPTPCNRPSLHPDRIEVVQVIVEDGARTIETAMEIIRPAGQKPYLSKPIDAGLVGACRWAGLLR
jgi:hypothetical protein